MFQKIKQKIRTAVLDHFHGVPCEQFDSLKSEKDKAQLSLENRWKEIDNLYIETQNLKDQLKLMSQAFREIERCVCTESISPKVRQIVEANDLSEVSHTKSNSTRQKPRKMSSGSEEK